MASPALQAIIGRAFNSFNECEAAVCDAAKTDAVRLVVHSKKPSSTPRRVIWRCCKGTKYTKNDTSSTHPSKQRKASTQSTDCKFKVAAKKQEDGNWVPEWPETAESRQHNHNTLEIAAYAHFRGQALEKHHADVLEMAAAGFSPKDILTKIRNGGETNAQDITIKDITNLLSKAKNKELNGRSPIKWLYNQISQNPDYFFRDQRNENGRLTRLFISPQSSRDLLKDFPEVLLFDSTYKTNRFNMPLFNICSSTSLKKTFQVAAVFLSAEKEADYSWAITQLTELLNESDIPPPRCVVTDRELALINALDGHELFHGLPHILYHWHININVISNTKKYFPKPTRGRDGVIQNDPKFKDFICDWHKLVISKSKDEYKENLAAFKALGHSREAVAYCLETWIYPWARQIVRYFIDQYPHFRHVTTSIVESSHASLKRFLQQHSTADLKAIFKKLHLFWHHQAAEARLEAQQRRNKIIANFHFLLQEIQFQVSPVTINLLLAQIHLLPRQGGLSSTCHCTIKATHGILYKHDLKTLLESSQPIQKSHLNPH